MGFYGSVILPRLLDFAMRRAMLRAEREKFVPLAEGIALEIGFGSGLNLPHYRRDLGKLFALEPSARLKRMAAARTREATFPVEFIGLSGEDIPLQDHSVDSVVTTWTLCTIPDVRQSLAEMRRVLKPSGRVIFIEHGRAPDTRVAAWQDRLNGLQQRIAGGCNLNREIDKLLQEAGFRIERIERGYLKGPRPYTYHYKGTAQIR